MLKAVRRKWWQRQWSFHCSHSRAVKEVKVEPDELPKQVANTVGARFPGLKYVSVAKESNAAGEVVYDIELMQSDRKFETDIKADGTMLEVEKELTKKAWPKGLHSTVEDKYPESTVKEVLEVDKVNGGKEVPITWK